jgi:hypothetical protein
VAIRALVTIALFGGAAEAGPFVHWQAPSSCPDAADVEQRVARRLGPDARSATPIDVTVRADSAGFAAEIGDVRTLTSASCAELADAAALVVARLVLEEPPPAQPAVAAPPAVVVTVEPPRPPAIEHAFAIGARLSAVSGVGVQPGLAIGGELAIPLRWEALFVEPAIAAWSPSTTSGTMSGVETSLREASLRIGWRSPAWPVRAWLVGDLGELHGEGVQVAGAQAGSAAWAGLGAGGAVTWAVDHHVAIVGAAEAIGALLRPRFTLVDGDVLYQPAAVAARLTLGVEVSWP